MVLDYVVFVIIIVVYIYIYMDSIYDGLGGVFEDFFVMFVWVVG